MALISMALPTIYMTYEYTSHLTYTCGKIYEYHKLDINDSLRINSSSKDKTFKTLNKNYSALINKLKKYNFTEEQLNKYKEIFNYLFIYLKLFIQKKIFNYIILYTNIKNKYISGFNQFIMFIKRHWFILSRLNSTKR